MGINHAMFTGVSGLKVNSDGMSIIANNIANSNTKAFKTDRAEFEDLLSLTLSENSQIGRGARLQSVKTIFTQGTLTNTDVVTDMGIQGDGFFIVKNENTESQESGGNFFTRVGSFHFNKEGVLVDTNGSRLQGYMADREGRVNSKLSDIEVSTNIIPPKDTSIVTLNANLDARAVAAPPFDVTKPEATSNFSSTVTVFDTMGRGHPVTLYFSKTNDMEKNGWEWRATINGQELAGSPERGSDDTPLQKVISQGKLEFDSSGKLVLPFKDKDGRSTFIDTMELSDQVELNFANGAKSQKVQFNFGGLIDENNRNSSQTTTSIASKSNTIFHAQNGYESGQLKSLRIDLDGTVRGVYTNGLEKKLAVIGMASFKNNNGLHKAGRNYFMATNTSGEPQIGSPLSGTRGSVYASSLEESNVDLAQQFVDMITTQRAFQANSKSITTTDTMMEEVLNLKR